MNLIRDLENFIIILMVFSNISQYSRENIFVLSRFLMTESKIRTQNAGPQDSRTPGPMALETETQDH